MCVVLETLANRSTERWDGRNREEEEGRAGWRVVREEGLALGLGQCRVSYKEGTEESMFIYRTGENSTV